MIKYKTVAEKKREALHRRVAASYLAMMATGELSPYKAMLLVAKKHQLTRQGVAKMMIAEGHYKPIKKRGNGNETDTDEGRHPGDSQGDGQAACKNAAAGA